MLVCLQLGTPIPPSVVESTQTFKSSRYARNYYSRRPNTMADLTFKLSDLRAAIKDGTMTDHVAIRNAALDLDRSFEAWATVLPPSWQYATLDVGDDTDSDIYFDGKRHVYDIAIFAQGWNDWRGRRILTNQLILRHGLVPADSEASACTEELEASQQARATAIANICKYSADICITSANLINTSRKQPLEPQLSTFTP
jgi:hypothetical protein